MVSILILSAGKGTRMKSTTPKVLHKICGKPMLFHIVEEAFKISSDVTVVVGHFGERVKSEISSYFPNLKFHTQNTSKFEGTGGAVMEFTPQNEKVLILNGDMPLIEAQDMEQFLKIDADIVMATISVENPAGYGRVITNGDEVLKIVEEKEANEEEKKVTLVNGGGYLIKKAVLEKYLPKLSDSNSQNEYYITDLIELVKNGGGEVKQITFSENSFFGVNSKLHLAQAEEICLERVRNQAMQNGATLHLPKTIYIEKGVELQGEVEIFQNSSISGNSKIQDSTILAGTVIESSEIINSTIGVMAHIRPNSKIENSKIGNFVEVKKSELSGVKAGHLAYLGDSEISEGTNIGAGVITANYDGKSKHKTKIGKNVFVGSDSQIIAPVEIEDEVMIGAGSTVTKNLPKGVLALSRAKLKTIPDFFYKFFKS